MQTSPPHPDAAPEESTAAHVALRHDARAWFESLRDRICAAFESVEQEFAAASGSTAPPARFERRNWQRPTEDGADGGGGVISLMHGTVLEKAGVNVSTVQGSFSPEFQASIPGAERDPRFWASGISLVVHPRNPLVPAAHFNTRLLVTTRGWFGGGGDITPMFPQDPAAQEDARDFHRAFERACDRHDPGYYPRFKAWCDEYFYLPHRREPRGLGGIFFDHHHTGDAQADFAFVRDVGLAFLESYPEILRRRINLPWTTEQREQQLVRRGRYVEFNLLYDRGTLFGLRTGGNVEAILMSLPPEVRWP